MTYIEPLPYPTNLNPFKAGQLPLRQGATEEGGNKNGDKTKKPTKKRKEMRTAARSTTEGQVAVSFALPDEDLDDEKKDDVATASNPLV